MHPFDACWNAGIDNPAWEGRQRDGFDAIFISRKHGRREFGTGKRGHVDGLMALFTDLMY